MKVSKFSEIRFADPVTAIDVVKDFVFYGSAMGRLVVIDKTNDKEIIFYETLPELVRAITHSADEQTVYVSVGDVKCILIKTSDLQISKTINLVDRIDDPSHQQQCERAYTMGYR